MALLNTSRQWGGISKTFHWLIALLIVVAIILGIAAEEAALSPVKLKLFIFHKSIGITVLVLVGLRLGWKLLTPQPSPAEGLTPRTVQLSRLGHSLLYALMFTLPLSGWVVTSAANIPFQWMQWFSVPLLPGIDKPWQSAAEITHKVLFLVLLAAVSGHVCMAFIHHYKHGSNILKRMWPAPSALGGALIILALCAGALGLYQAIKPAVVVTTDKSDTVAGHHDQAATPARSDRQQWQPLASQSQLGFTGAYDGVTFDGEFKQFSARLFFDPADISNGLFDVSINTDSVTTYTQDWDASLPDPEWFSTSRYPKAYFRAEHFDFEGENYIAHGQLSLKGVSKPVDLHFSWQARPDGTVNFDARAVVDRTEFGIGSGMWSEDPTIGFEVKIHAQLLLVPATGH